MGYIMFDVDRSYKSQRREAVSRFLSIFFSLVFFGLSLALFKVFKERSEKLRTEISSAAEDVEELSREQRELNKIVASLKKKQRRVRKEIEGKKEVIETVNEVVSPITEMMNRVESVVESNKFLIEDFSFKEGSLYLHMRTPQVETGKILRGFEEEFYRVVLKERSKKRTIIKVEGINEGKD